MTTPTRLAALQCQIVEDDVEMTLAQLCQACGAEREQVVQLVAQGVVEPQGDAPQGWVFVGASLRRTRVAVRLMRDLELDPPGAALAVELLERIEQLQRELQSLKPTERS